MWWWVYFLCFPPFASVHPLIHWLQEGLGAATSCHTYLCPDNRAGQKQQGSATQESCASQASWTDINMTAVGSPTCVKCVCVELTLDPVSPVFSSDLIINGFFRSMLLAEAEAAEGACRVSAATVWDGAVAVYPTALTGAAWAAMGEQSPCRLRGKADRLTRLTPAWADRADWLCDNVLMYLDSWCVQKERKKKPLSKIWLVLFQTRPLGEDGQDARRLQAFN